MIFRIFRKELLDTLRDKRTLMTMLVIPVLVFPITLNVFVEVSKSFEESASEKTMKIGIVGDQSRRFSKQLEQIPKELGPKKILVFKDSADLKKGIESDQIQLGLLVPFNEADLRKTQQTVPLTWLLDASEVGRAERAQQYGASLQAFAEAERLQTLGLRPEQVKPLSINTINCASDKKMVGQLAGGFLPYIFIAFGFIGCMYPAIDLFTGEKERGTLETLLTVPVSRWKILIGKMLVVVCSGMLAATCALIGLFISIEFLDLAANKELLDVIHSVLTPVFILSMFALLLPLVIFFSGVMIPIAIYAKSFKEAQSIITPLNIVMVLPAMIGFFPGIELNLNTTFIPVVNVVLATKELVAGTLSWLYFGSVFGVMCLLAALAIGLSYKQFGKETNILS
ncbi:MAG: ABC transporter permease [Sphingomonadales bacterium]|nr:ABC transporter permease [Sphingomonadales bacterium]